MRVVFATRAIPHRDATTPAPTSVKPKMWASRARSCLVKQGARPPQRAALEGLPADAVTPDLPPGGAAPPTGSTGGRAPAAAPSPRLASANGAGDTGAGRGSLAPAPPSRAAFACAEGARAAHAGGTDGVPNGAGPAISGRGERATPFSQQRCRKSALRPRKWRPRLLRSEPRASAVMRDATVNPSGARGRWEK